MGFEQQKQLINPLHRINKLAQNFGQENPQNLISNPMFKVESTQDLAHRGVETQKEDKRIPFMERIPKQVQVVNVKTEERQLINPMWRIESQQPQSPEIDIHGLIGRSEALRREEMPISLFVPTGVQPDEYIKQAEIKKHPHEIAEDIKNQVVIRSLEGELYVFNPVSVAYERWDNNKLVLLLDQLARDEIVKQGKSSAYREVINYLKYDHTIAIKEEEILPGNIWVFRNCFVNICTGERVPNDGRFFTTSTLQCDYIPNAYCPFFDNFILSLTGGDSNLIELIWEIIGYLLSTDTQAKSYFVMLGPKDTGKSLLVNVISSFFLLDCISGLGISDFGTKFALDELRNRRINTCSDLTDESIPPRAVGAIKMITGGDLVRTDRKFMSAKTFRCTAKLIFSANQCLKLDRPDEAFSERQVTVPCLYPIPKECQDKQLLSKLQSELPGIAVKAAAAYRRLVSNNYVFPEVLLPQIPDSFKYDDEKIITDFIQGYCDFSDSSAKVFTQDIFEVYQMFCIRHKVQAISELGAFSASFNQLINGRAERKKVNISGKTLQGYLGVKLKVPGM